MGRDPIDRIEVRPHEFVVLDRLAERLLEEADDLEHARRIYHARVRQRCAVGEAGGIRNEEDAGAAFTNARLGLERQVTSGRAS